MKRICVIALVICIFGVVNAQNSVQNGGFETWAAGGLLSQEQPQDWTAALVGSVTQELFGVNIPIPVNTYFGTKSTDAHGGSYALKLQANTVGITGTDYSFLMPGVAQLGHAEGFSIPLSAITDLVGMISNQDTTGMGDFDWESLASLAKVLSPGMPCTEVPTRVSMWAKYYPQNGDSLMLIAFAKDGGSIFSFAQLTCGSTLDEYTQLTADFDVPLQPCDSLCIIIISGGFNTDANTVLYVDDVCIDYELGVEDVDLPKISVYPNPTVEMFSITVDADDVYGYQLTDMSGKTVASADENEGVTMVDVRDLTPGMYLLKVIQNGKSVTRKVVIQ